MYNTLIYLYIPTPKLTPEQLVEQKQHAMLFVLKYKHVL